jgi:protoporphyrinogen oxidase
MVDTKGDIIDLAVIGSGISGINAAYRAQAAFPGINYEVFESRKEIGGT